jgi:hypothetical protein
MLRSVLEIALISRNDSTRRRHILTQDTELRGSSLKASMQLRPLKYRHTWSLSKSRPIQKRVAAPPTAILHGLTNPYISSESMNAELRPGLSHERPCYRQFWGLSAKSTTSARDTLIPVSPASKSHQQTTQSHILWGPIKLINALAMTSDGTVSCILGTSTSSTGQHLTLRAEPYPACTCKPNLDNSSRRRGQLRESKLDLRECLCNCKILLVTARTGVRDCLCNCLGSACNCFS